MANNRIERLMNLVAFLSDTKRAITLREIIATIPGYPESLKSARRAFERDKEDLRAMNFDIQVLDTPDGESGYRILKETTYFNVKLTSAQRSIVEYALSLYGPQESIANAAVTKLGGMNPENIVGEVTSLAMPDMVDELYAAATAKRNVVITFKNSQRHISPQRIIARAGYWYVQAHDLDLNESRTFRIDRISDVENSRGEYHALDAEIVDEDIDASIHISVRVHPALIEQFCATWSGTYDEENDLVRFSISRTELFLSRLYEYSGFVAVIEPVELVEEIESQFDRARMILEEVS